MTTMYTPEHIAALLSVIAEQRKEIESLRGQLDSAMKEAERNWRWYQEEEAEVKKLKGQTTHASDAK